MLLLFINKVFYKVPISSIMHKKDFVYYKQFHVYIFEEQSFILEKVVYQKTGNIWRGYEFGNLFQ